jgi:hypothetical protein
VYSEAAMTAHGSGGQEAEATEVYRNIDCFYSREHELFRKTQVTCVGVVITIAV